MVRGFFAARIVLAGVGENVGSAGQRANLDFLHVIRMQVIALYKIEHCGDGSVRESLRRESLHSALRHSPSLAEAVGQQIELPVWFENVSEPLFAVDDVFGSGGA